MMRWWSGRTRGTERGGRSDSMRANRGRTGRIVALSLALALAAVAGLPGLSGAEGEPGAHAAYLAGPFAGPTDVTRACLECHPDAGPQILSGTHWTWSAEQEVPDPRAERGRRQIDRGKKNTVNNFCIALPSNWPRCTSCHIGYGWKDASFDHADAAQIDCLVCHETTGTYKKSPAGAGMPEASVDLLQVAQSVGRTSIASCGSCHFYGGGGDHVKHGDLDGSLVSCSPGYDVHLSAEGANLTCGGCHGSEGHRMRGDAMAVSPAGSRALACVECHPAEPHEDAVLNRHGASVACQTCHIPSFAKDRPTKVWWDWSTAGKDLPASPDSLGQPTYDKKKGSFRWARNIVPEYAWYNGEAEVYVLGDAIDPAAAVALTRPSGRRDDPKSRIAPFKVHRGRQPYDEANRTLLVPHLFGPGGYWERFDWDLASRDGMAAAGLPYSGHVGFVETTMYWPLNHMVVPGETALACADCHGAGGRMDWAALGYPGDPQTTPGAARPRP